MCNSPERERQRNQHHLVKLDISDKSISFSNRCAADNPHWKASNMSADFEVSSWTVPCFLHKSGDYNEKRGGYYSFDWPKLSIENICSVLWWRGYSTIGIVIFSEESSITAFTESVRVCVWWLCDQEFYVKRLQPTTGLCVIWPEWPKIYQIRIKGFHGQNNR